MLGKVPVSHWESRRQFKCVELRACPKLYKAKERPGNNLVSSGGGLVAKLCLTLCDPKDCSPPGSSVHRFSRQEYWSGLPFPSPGWTWVSCIPGRLFTSWATRVNLISNSWLNLRFCPCKKLNKTKLYTALLSYGSVTNMHRAPQERSEDLLVPSI